MTDPIIDIEEPARRTPVHDAVDVLVLGGGPAGIAAAIAAARAGSRTLLVERYGFLGGMGTAAGVTNFCGLHANVYGEVRQVVHGVADDLLARMRGLGGLNEPHPLFGGKIFAQAYDNATFKIAADEAVLASGARVLFHALAVGVIMAPQADRREIRGVVIETRSGRRVVLGKRFIDCSGDGDLLVHAGARWEQCGKTDDGALLYPSTMFRMHGVDPVRAQASWQQPEEWLNRAAEMGYRFPHRKPVLRPQKRQGEWRANVTQIANPDGSPVDATDALALSDAEITGRRQVVEFLRFLQGQVSGFEDAYLLDIAPQVGVRETRRAIGAYQLTEADVLGCARFEDSIGVNGWPVEAHVSGDVIFRFPDIPASCGYNQLPYRMLLPQGVANLLVAGRCASMTHMGQSAARVSGACFVMGEAAGSAAALSLAQGIDASQLAPARLQAHLRDHGAWLG